MPRVHCHIDKIMEASRPPDPDLVDLIEQAFLEGQIDGETLKLAYYSLDYCALTKLSFVMV